MEPNFLCYPIALLLLFCFDSMQVNPQTLEFEARTFGMRFDQFHMFATVSTQVTRSW